MLDVAAIERELGVRSIGRRLHYLPQVDSTNTWLRSLVQAGAAAGTVVYTDFQSSGRGRSGRSWHAPEGTSILHSLALPRSGAAPMDAVALVALAIRSAIRQRLKLDATLKWPNDVEIAGRKVCGILAETVTLSGTQIVIVGAGINCNFLPNGVKGMPDSATSLQQELGRPIDREDLAVAVLQAVNEIYNSVRLDEDATFNGWRSALSTPGHEVIVNDGSGAWTGHAKDVNRDGSLLVLRDGTLCSVYAADVSIRLAE